MKVKNAPSVTRWKRLRRALTAVFAPVFDRTFATLRRPHSSSSPTHSAPDRDRTDPLLGGHGAATADYQIPDIESKDGSRGGTS